jgi:hypothetical protein
MFKSEKSKVDDVIKTKQLAIKIEPRKKTRRLTEMRVGEDPWCHVSSWEEGWEGGGEEGRGGEEERKRGRGSERERERDRIPLPHVLEHCNLFPSLVVFERQPVDACIVI